MWKKAIKEKDDNQPPASGGTSDKGCYIWKNFHEDVKTKMQHQRWKVDGFERVNTCKHVFAYAVETACDKHECQCLSMHRK